MFVAAALAYELLYLALGSNMTGWSFGPLWALVGPYGIICVHIWHIWAPGAAHVWPARVHVDRRRPGPGPRRVRNHLEIRIFEKMNTYVPQTSPVSHYMSFSWIATIWRSAKSKGSHVCVFLALVLVLISVMFSVRMPCTCNMFLYVC